MSPLDNYVKPLGGSVSFFFLFVLSPLSCFKGAYFSEIFDGIHLNWESRTRVSYLHYKTGHTIVETEVCLNTTDIALDNDHVECEISLPLLELKST